MLATNRAESREKATQRGQQLIVGNLLYCATDERDFEDSKHAYYRCDSANADRFFLLSLRRSFLFSEFHPNTPPPSPHPTPSTK